MITCYLRYVIDPFKLTEFEYYGRLWIPLVEKFGGKHHGYFLPAEGANNIALAMFTFPSLAQYEDYRLKSCRTLNVRLHSSTQKKRAALLAMTAPSSALSFRKNALSMQWKTHKRSTKEMKEQMKAGILAALAGGLLN